MENNREELYKELRETVKNWTTDQLTKKVQGMLKVTDEEYKNISFCILLIFWVETILKEVLKELVLKYQKSEKQYPEFIDAIFNETTFGSKITIVEFIINQSEKFKKTYKDFFSYCRALNGLRNQIFHTKLKDIKYNGLSISEIKTQRKMFIDLIESRMKMGINFNRA